MTDTASFCTSGGFATNGDQAAKLPPDATNAFSRTAVSGHTGSNAGLSYENTHTVKQVNATVSRWRKYGCGALRAFSGVSLSLPLGSYMLEVDGVVG